MSKIKILITSLLTVIFAVILTMLSIIYVYFYLIKPPFTNANLNIDLGILILKDGFVRFIWIIFDLVILIFLLRFILKKINELKKINIKNYFQSFIKKKEILTVGSNKIENKPLNVVILSVKDFMNKEGYISVHNNVRANSKNFLYVTFIKENNSAMNIYISKRTSKYFYEGQEIIKGFFDDLVIAMVNEKIKLVSSTDYSELNFSLKN